MEKIWLKSYEKGVPESIQVDEQDSLISMLTKSVWRYPSLPSYSNMGKTLNYTQLDHLSKAFAGFLQQHCKLSAGERVIIMLPNSLQYPVALFGILRAGLIVVNMNPQYTPREIQHVLEDSGASCIIVLENFAHVLEEVLHHSTIQHVIVTQIGDLLGPLKGHCVNWVVKYVKKMVPSWHIANAHRFQKALQTKYEKAFVTVPLGGKDTAFLQYTGGTTGEAKGTVLTHQNIMANLKQASSWIQPFIQREGMKPGTAGIITALPLYHIFSLLANCLLFFELGICNILITNPRDIKTFVKELKRQPFSVITGVNTLFNALLRNADFRALSFASLKFSLAGGMALQKSVADKWHQVTGVPILEAYGLTETSPAVTINPFNLTEYNGSIGLPLPSTDIKITDLNDNEVDLGEVGELCVKGPQVMQGYWHQPEETQLALREGWLHTGDLAKMDDKGFIYIAGRKKEMILVSGFKVYPHEVEEVISQIPGVREVAVIGVKSQQHGEVVKAFIVSQDPNLTEKDVIAHCHQGLTGYKVPKLVEFRTELPKSQVGKVLHRVLREEEDKKSVS